MSVHRDDAVRELVTLHMPMSPRTFNALLNLLQQEWPDSIPVTDVDNPFVVRVLSRAPDGDER